jgi:hypothetical protein
MTSHNKERGILLLGKEFKARGVFERVNDVFLCKVRGIGFFQQKLPTVNTYSNAGDDERRDFWFGVGAKEGLTRSERMDWVCWEAVVERTKTACLGFSTTLGARFSSSRFVRAFLGFLGN